MTSSSPAKATRKEWIGLAVIALPCLVYAMDLTVLNLAVPAISTQLRPSSSQLLWIIDIYGFLVAGLLITMGTLGDRIGRRKLLMMGAGAFAAASAVAAFSDSAGMLIAMRALLGMAGATLAPSTLSLIRNMFRDEHERQFAIGVWMASFSLGGAIGPLVGGVLLQFFWWGSVFLIAVPVMMLLLVLGPMLLPEYRDPEAGRVDALSVVFSLAAVLSVIYGLKQIAQHGLGWEPAGAIAAGVAIGAAFLRRQRRLPYPLLDTSLFRRPAFSAAIATYSLSGLAMFGVYIFITQYLQLVLGLDPVRAGLATAPWALGFVAGSLLSPRLARHITPIAIFVGGLLVAATGFLLIHLAAGPYALEAIVTGMVVMSLGLAPVFTLGNEIIITSAPPERAGAASALSETGAEFSAALGIAVFGSLGTMIYRTAMEQAMPAGLSPELAADASSTIGGAVATAQSLSGAMADALLAAAHSAFSDALQFTAILGAVVVTCAAAIAARMLRGFGKPRPAIGDHTP